MKRTRVGIIGLGAISQLVYLPILDALRDRFELVALCDASRNVLQAIAGRYANARAHTEASGLVAQKDLDAVIVANSDEYHVPCTLDALKHGKHVLIEKPMCFSLREAEEIVRARDENHVVAMVGYVRRYSDAFQAAKREMRGIQQVLYVRIRDILGYNSVFMRENSNLHRADDLPDAFRKDREQRLHQSLSDVFGGSYTERQKSVYQYLTGIGCHDLSAMRDLLGGMPLGVASTVTSSNNHYLAVLLKYDGYNVLYESGIDSQKRRDSVIEVFSEEKTIKLDFGCFYYLRQIPDALEINECLNPGYSEKRITPTYTDAYTRELEAFHEVVTSGAPVRTPPEDYAEDLRLFGWILDAMQ